jgi:DNA repair protein RecN (Recombination protein N)
MENRDNIESQLKIEREIFARAFKKFARTNYDLSVSRRARSDSFTEAIKRELTELGMESTEIGINLTDGILLGDMDTFLELDTNSINMCDLLQAVEFMISPGKGESFKNLQKVASGGEAARLMLAFKVSSINSNFKRSLILDEIDYGIGGRLGSIIGKKLSRLSINNQVICVTHLPQLAIFADNHIKVEKMYSKDRTISVNSYVDGADRINEINSMYGDTNYMSDTANQLLQDAGYWKQSLREPESVPA